MRHFLLFLAFVAGAGLAFVGVVFLWDGDMTGLLTGLLLAALGLGLVIGAIVSIRRKGRQMREDLLAGTDVIARWQLSPADLAAFQAVDRERASAGSYFRNWLNIPKTAPMEGIPIVVGRESWLIGGRLYAQGQNTFGMLANVAALEGDPGYIEVALLGQKSGTGYLLILLRLPVPIGARSTARTAAAHLADLVLPQNHEQLRHSFPDYVYGLTG